MRVENYKLAALRAVHCCPMVDHRAGTVSNLEEAR
jgi:hypothetical protein